MAATIKKPINEEVRKYLSAAGSIGGSSKSPTKKRAASNNLKNWHKSLGHKVPTPSP